MLAVIPGITSCGQHADRPPEEAAPQLNVLLVTFDTTRADHLGCYGGKDVVTPVVDQLAASGVRFGSAFCQVPLTLPSHLSLLTGRYPAATGVRINAHGVKPADVEVIAREFQRRGYDTGAFVASIVLASAFGLS